MKTYIENPRGHVWQEFDGEIDIFAYADGFHNGPRCIKCGYAFCHHCEAGPDHDCPVNAESEK